MAYTGRDRDTIRDELLSLLRTEHASSGRTLLILRGSYDFNNATALAVMLEGLEAQAEQNGREIFVKTASDEGVALHGQTKGVARRNGVAASHTISVTGTPSATITIPAGTMLTWTDGTMYLVSSTSVTLNGSGDGTITATATTIGDATTRAGGDVLTFVSAPSGLDPTGDVATTVTSGSDQETIQAWAQRIAERDADRPASGNDADWRDWCRSFRGYDIRDAYVYPLLAPPASYPGLGTVGVLGTVSVVVVGKPQGDSTTNTRIVGNTAGALLSDVREYLNGTRDVNGLPTTSGRKLIPSVMSVTDVSIEAAAVTSQNVTATVTVNDANAYPFNFTATVDASSTTTSLVLVGNYALTLASTPVLLEVGTGNYRGGWFRVVLPSGTYNGGTGNTTFDLTSKPLPGAPTGDLYPAPGNWSLLRLAAFNFFDALGPGNHSPLTRFPREDYSARATLYVSALEAALSAVPGVLSVTVTTPSGTVTPDRKTIVTLGLFLTVQ